ncbi:HEAT repeat domain-containing protein [Pontiellaceae bacterium B1224]|nr:HEAT repeat domain-containing protein [Pontiellaceae bacterium B1224]
MIVATVGTVTAHGAPPTSATPTLPPPTNAPANGKTSISIQEMLKTGPTQLKMHSLMMVLQGNIKVDDSYLPGLLICAQDQDALLRSTSARILGENFIANQENPNQEVLEILTQLAQDPSADVRFNAAYYGLSQIGTITPELAELLIDIAANERKPELQDRIIIALANYQPQVIEIFDRKLSGNNSIAYFEIYEEFTGSEPENAEKYLDMPSSRPHLIIVKPTGKDASTAKSSLIAALEKDGLKNPSVVISGKGENFVLMLTTYITRDYQTAKAFLTGNEKFPIMQDMWLTPELEIQIEAIRKTP